MVEKIMKSAPHGGGQGNNHDLYDTTGGPGGGSGGHHGPLPGGGGNSVGNNGVTHPLSSANPPGLPRPPLHPALSHNHGHSHLMAGPGGPTHQQHNGSPMQRLTHSGLPHHGGHGPEKPHHGGHGPAPPPPTTHISNPPLVSSQHPMSNLSTSTTITATGRDPVSGGRESNPMRSEQQQQQPSQSLVSNGGLNGHTNIQGTQLFGDTEPENEKWWWVCCLEFCFCLL